MFEATRAKSKYATRGRESPINQIRDNVARASFTKIYHFDLANVTFQTALLLLSNPPTNPPPHNTTIMPTTRKRKGSPALEEAAEFSKRRFAENENAPVDEAVPDQPATDARPENLADDPPSTETAAPTSAASATPDDRAARFAALRARNLASRKDNLQATKTEAQRAAIDPSQLSSLNRKREIASHKLLQAETEDAGEDFERKRAWDWTVEESERWDRRMAKKERNREGTAFRDYSHAAGQVYKRQVRGMEKGAWEERKGEYERERAEEIERAVKSGGLEIVETEEGELVAVDREGGYFSQADIAQFGERSKPDRAAVDRLVADLKKADEIRVKKHKDRRRNDDAGQDVTYINEQNKHFNAKLDRAYGKYTKEIRDNFERGTAI